jgi:hypothetical protein
MSSRLYPGATTTSVNTTGNVTAANATLSGDVAVNGGDITTTATTMNVVNTTATTVNAFGAATTLELGAATGTTSINNALTVDGNTTLGNADSDTTTVRGLLKLADDDASNFVSITSNATVGTDYTITLPAAQGASGDVLQNDGSGNLSWVANTAATSLTFVTVTANATVATSTDVELVDAATATITVPVGTNKRYTIKKINSGAGSITITPSSGNIYDYGGLTASTTIAGDGESIDVVANGTNLYVV